MATPGQANVYVEPKPLEVKLAEQNEEGDDFFLDFLEKESDGAFDNVVDLHVQLSNESLATIGKQNDGRESFSSCYSIKYESLSLNSS